MLTQHTADTAMAAGNRRVRRSRITAGLALATAVALTAGLTACSGSDEPGAAGEDSTDTITVVYQKFGSSESLEGLMTRTKAAVEKANEGKTVKLVPIEAEATSYFTKLALMNQSGSEAPDVMYEDSFMVKTDADAGYLLPLDDFLADWSDWDQYYENAKAAGQGSDGKTYAVSLSTDTRAIWVNKEILKKAGLDENWQPKNWQDIFTAAETIKEKVPGVIPLNLFSGKAAGEAAAMQGFEMLLYGTEDTLFDTETNKWVVGSQGFKDSLQFVQDLYTKGLGPTPQQALDAQIQTVVSTEWMPQGKVAMNIDGSWLPGNWQSGGGAEWPEWDSVLTTVKMPTQKGQAPGAISMSGGHTLAIGANTKAPKLAQAFLKEAFTQQNATKFAVEGSGIAVRKDVAAAPEYADSNSSFGVLSEVVDVTQFRPATSEYPEISNNIVIAMEAVMTGDKSVADAAKAYDEAVIRIVGKENTTAGK